MDQDSIIERVRKILAKVGRGATEEEAATAVAMAARILADHNLSMADVSAAESTWAEGVCFTAKRCPAELPWLAPILEGFFFVRCMSERYVGVEVRGVLFGEPSAVEVATWIFGRLTDQYRDLFRAFRARTGAKVTRRGGYYAGLTSGLEGRLSAERGAAAPSAPGVAATGRDLAVADIDRRISDAFAIAHPECGAPRIEAVQVGPEYHHGVRDSSTISLARPIGGASRLALPSPETRS